MTIGVRSVDAEPIYLTGATGRNIVMACGSVCMRNGLVLSLSNPAHETTSMLEDADVRTRRAVMRDALG